MTSKLSASHLGTIGLVLGCLIVLGLSPILSAAETNTQPGNSPAKQPEVPSFEDLERQVLNHRAIEAVIWGMPAVNRDLMYQAMLRETKARDNQILYWSRLLDWKNQTLTPNTDVIYLTPHFDTKDVGPVVLEIPPADGGVINGTIMDAWQTPLEDVGPAGVDKGKGGKYLILPPGHTDKAPDGYIVLPSSTYKGYALLRSIRKSGSEEDLAKAVEYGKRIKIYPLSKADNPPPTICVDAAGVLYDATIPYDIRYFESLARVIHHEPWLERDRAMIDTLRTLGIEKEKKFAPDAKMVQALNDAAKQAHHYLEGKYHELVTNGPFAPGSRGPSPCGLHRSSKRPKKGSRTPTFTRSRIAASCSRSSSSCPSGWGRDSSTCWALKTRKASRSMAARRIGSKSRPTPPQSSTGRRRCTIGRRTRSSAICPTRPVPPRARDCRSTKTGRWTCTSGRKPRRAKNRTGLQPIRTGNSRSCSASTARCHRFSTRHGCCRTSNSRIETTSAIPLADDPSVPSLEFLGQADAECPHRVPSAGLTNPNCFHTLVVTTGNGNHDDLERV